MSVERYGVSAPTAGDTADIAGRFATEPAEGPMRSRRSQLIADAIHVLLRHDTETSVSVPEPVVPIDPISYQPNYDQAEHKVVIDTSVPQDATFAIFQESEAALIAAAEGRF